MTDHGDQIGVVARRHGVSPATLRYYEDRGLLPAPERTPAGYRIYGDRHDERLRFIARAKDLDLSLDDIRLLLDAREAGGCGDAREQLRHTVADKLVEARRRASEARLFADQLADVHDRLTAGPADMASCERGCQCVPELPDAATVSM